jgi:hypothetical protein
MVVARVVSFITILAFIIASQIPPPGTISNTSDGISGQPQKLYRLNTTTFVWWEIKPNIKIQFHPFTRVKVSLELESQPQTFSYQLPTSSTAIELLKTHAARGPPAPAC